MRSGRCDTTEVGNMRHRIGIVLAVVMIGVLFFPGAWGYLRLLRLPAPVGQLSQLPAGGGSLISDHNVLIALAAITGTGLLAGVLIAVPRISPLAAGLPGLLLLGWTALYLVNVRQGGRPDPAAVRSLRRRLRGHALQRDSRGGRAGDDPPDVRAVAVAGPQGRRERGHRSRRIHHRSGRNHGSAGTDEVEAADAAHPGPDRQPGATPGGAMARGQPAGKQVSQGRPRRHQNDCRRSRPAPRPARPAGARRWP